MTGFLEDDFLEFEGLDQQDIQNLNAIMPDLKQLAQVLQQNWTTINKVVTVLLPIVEKIIAKQESLK